MGIILRMFMFVVLGFDGGYIYVGIGGVVVGNLIGG